MSENTLEGWFLRDYERVKAENESLKEQVAAYESRFDGYGITDLHQMTKAIRGAVTSDWAFSEYLLENGKYTVEQVEGFIAECDDDLFERFDGMKLGYYLAATIEEHEFPYTLRIRETRCDWVGVTDGNEGSDIIMLADLDEGVCLNAWFPESCRDAMVHVAADMLRDSLRGAIERYEKKMAEKGE